MQAKNFNNGVSIRSKNKRVTVYRDIKGKTTVLISAALPLEELSFEGNKILKGKVKQTGFSLSTEAAYSLYYALHSFLKRESENDICTPEPQIS